MNSEEFGQRLNSAVYAIEALRNNSGTDIVEVRLMQHLGEEIWLMAVNVSGIPCVDDDFCDTTLFTAHQGIITCDYYKDPVAHFLIRGYPSAVQHCVISYVLTGAAATLCDFAKRYRTIAMKSPAEFPLSFCDARKLRLNNGMLPVKRYCWRK
jgi:hypothetical protein